jgi:hypothetical protein
MGGSLASLTQAIQTARGFSEATTGATDTMRRLAADLHVMGLNAQVQAVQAKNGSLEVLAGAASAISGEAGALTLNFERKLVVTTEALATLVRGNEASHEKTRAHYETIQTQDAAIFHQLKEEHEASKALVQTVGSLLHQLKSHAAELLGSVDLADFSRDPIERTRTIFTSLVEVCSNASNGDALADQAVLAEVQSRYTMNSERDAHAAVLAGRNSVTPVPPVSSAPGAGGDVELFDEPAPAASVPSSQLGDNVELF